MKNLIRFNLVIALIALIAATMLWANNQELRQQNEQLIIENWDLKNWITNNQ